MALQKQVYTSVAPGVPGSPATPDQAIYTAVNHTAEMTCTLGNFVFEGSGLGLAAPGGTVVLGLAQRVINYVNWDMRSPGTLDVPDGSTLTVAVKGDFWAVSDTAAAVGDAVFANTGNGMISTAAPGSTVTNAVDTGWRVKTAGDAGQPIIISNWGVAV
jgi:hypothetical protein